MMTAIQDNRGFNQVWGDSTATRIRAERRCDQMIRNMDLSIDRSIMEIGCGTGENAYMLAQKTGQQVMGIDICAPFIEQARLRPPMENLQYQVIDFKKPHSLTGKKFDYIVGNGILHHLYYSIDETLVAIGHLLKSEGSILFYEPNIYNPYCALIFQVPFLRKKTRLEPDEMAFSKRFITKKLASASFKNIVVEYRDFLLPGIPECFIRPSIVLGDIIERIPPFNRVSQSLFIKAEKE
jgi:2-polyprenyl-3-methyl-5-hydroxy-6-metoxy-1,4-benzoquinol methylase